MVDAVRLLLNDHDRLRALLAAFEQETLDRQRGVLATLLDVELRVHATLEQEIFYPGVALAAAPDAAAPPGATPGADLERAREDEMALVRRLCDLVVSGQSYGTTFACLKRLVLDHFRAEEEGHFLLARGLGEENLERIGWLLATRRDELVAQLWPGVL